MMKKLRHKMLPPGDDGRVIADMNIEGMPWYLDKRLKQKKESMDSLNLTKGERRAVLKGVMMAVVPVILLFVAAYFLLFLFLDLVWLR